MTEPEIISIVKDTIRTTLAQSRREKMLQELRDKKYVTQSEALRYLGDVAIGRARLKRMMDDGIIRVRDKENFNKRNSSVRLYAEDIYKILNQ